MTRSSRPCFAAAALAALLCWAGSGRAQAAMALACPEGAIQSAQQDAAPGRYGLPAEPFAHGEVVQQVFEGHRSRLGCAPALAGEGSVLRVFQSLAEQVEANGFVPILRCGAEDCGGFDFRQALDLLPPPAMFFDLSEYYVLTAQRPDGPAPEGMMLVVSRSASRIYWQLTRITATQPEPSETPIAPLPPEPGGTTASAAAPVPSVAAAPDSPDSLAAQLERLGKAVLEDVEFASGGSQMSDDDPASLAALAAYLLAHPARQAVIVGHSDSSGAAAANLSLSKQRAAAVRRRLIERFGVPAAQISADGVGQLVPRDSNATEAGRARNRRVEVVLY